MFVTMHMYHKSPSHGALLNSQIMQSLCRADEFRAVILNEKDLYHWFFEKIQNFCLQVTSILLSRLRTCKNIAFICFLLWRKQQLFLIVILSSCLVLVSRINSIRSITNRCSAPSFLLFSTVFLRVYLALQSNQKRKGRMLSQMMLHGKYFNDLELKCFQSSCLALFFSSFASPI